jgi:hypothetical protein
MTKQQAAKSVVARRYLSAIGFSRKGYSGVQHREFMETFGTPLQTYWDGIFGFDVVKFDHELVKSPDGVSCRDAVKKRWGKKAVDLVMALMAI